MRQRVAADLLASWEHGQPVGPVKRSGLDTGSAGPSRSLETLRWFEYSGLLVLIAVLGEAGNAGASVTGLIDTSGLCVDTVYSALTIAASLGFVYQEVVRARVPMTKRYYLTDVGRKIAEAVQQARSCLNQLSVPAPRSGSRGRVEKALRSRPSRPL